MIGAFPRAALAPTADYATSSLEDQKTATELGFSGIATIAKGDETALLNGSKDFDIVRSSLRLSQHK